MAGVLTSKLKLTLKLAIPLTLSLSAFAQASPTCKAPVYSKVKLLRTITRSVRGETEGLVYDHGRLLESSGGAPSALNSIDLETGRVTELEPTAQGAFGEGIVKIGSEVVQLTYQEKKIFVYDTETWTLKRTVDNSFSAEGWGLTVLDDNTLLATDGTGKLYEIDAQTFALKKTVDLDMPGVNSIQKVGHFLFANMYSPQYPTLLKFDLDTNCLVGMIDISDLYRLLSKDDLVKMALDSDRVPNGIAYDADHDVFYITGKQWSKIFEVKLSH